MMVATPHVLVLPQFESTDRVDRQFHPQLLLPQLEGVEALQNAACDALTSICVGFDSGGKARRKRARDLDGVGKILRWRFHENRELAYFLLTRSDKLYVLENNEGMNFLHI